MAKGRSSGVGLVITLIVFILIAIAGIGLSIHLYQQWMLAEEAIDANQRDFAEHIKPAFEEAGWNLPERRRDDYGIIYDRDTYAKVAEKLGVAGEFETMQPLLPWESTAEVREALSEYMPDEDEFQRIEGLLEYYSRRYDALRERVAELNRQRAAFDSQMEEKDAEFERMQTDLNRQLEQLEASYGERLAEIRAQYSEMEERWDRAREETGDSFLTLRERIEALQGAIEEGEAQLAVKEERVEELKQKLAVEEPEEFVPEGEVIAVERPQDIIMVAGGKEAGHQRGDWIVIYREAPDGKVVYIGTAVIAKVYEASSMANLTETEHPVLTGQLFVRKSTWDDVDPTEMAERPANLAP